jgi:hypothetical protein
MKLVDVVLIVVGAAFIAACAASSPTMSRTKDTQERPTFDDPREEIEYLAGEIDTMLGRDTGGDSTTGTTHIEADPGAEPMSADSPDSGGAYDACSDVCTIGDSICDNAERICRLAEQLAPDDWADGKCSDATESCTAAGDNCEECRG